MNRWLVGLVCILAVMNARATDIKREMEYADEIIKTLTVGQSIQLGAGGHQFLGIYTETEQVAHDGVAIILHDKGGHPDQKPLIHALRTELPKHKWATLTLQMPLREPGIGSAEYYALFPEVVPRIRAAIDYLAQAEAGNLVLIGYGLGSLMALYTQNELPNQFKAVAAIGLPVPETDSPMVRTLKFIERTKIPLLDIYGELDAPAVTGSALKRRLAAKENEAYRQMKINDEGHLYLHDEGLMVKRVYSWLRRVAAQFQQQQNAMERNR